MSENFGLQAAVSLNQQDYCERATLARKKFELTECVPSADLGKQQRLVAKNGRAGEAYFAL